MKRILDILISIFTLLIFGPLILSLIVIQTMDTKQFGLFRQMRVGKKGKLFYVYKIRTMIKDKSITTNITTAKDTRITKNGKFLRKYKFDELPQFFNVFIGNMVKIRRLYSNNFTDITRIKSVQFRFLRFT